MYLFTIVENDEISVLCEIRSYVCGDKDEICGAAAASIICGNL